MFHDLICMRFNYINISHKGFLFVSRLIMSCLLIAALPGTKLLSQGGAEIELISPERFESLILSEGIEEFHVENILRDSEGYMWFGTKNGLYRYDGSNIITYRHDPFNQNSLTNNRILAIREDSKGHVWISTSYGLNKYDRTTETFQRYYPEYADEKGAGNNIIGDMAIDREGHIWIGSWTNGLGRFHQKTASFEHYICDSTVSNGLRSNTVSSLLIDKAGNLWIGTHGGLEKYNPVENNFQHILFSGIDNKQSDVKINAIYEDTKGQLWLGTLNGVIRFNCHSRKTRLFKFDTINPVKNVNNNIIEAFAEDDFHHIWIGTHNGLYKYDGRNFTGYYHSASDEYTLSTNKIFDLYNDEHGTLWIGTSGGKIHKSYMYKNKFRTYVLVSNNLDDLKVTSVFKDSNEHIWFGTENGLYRFNRDKMNVSHYNYEPENPDALQDNLISGITTDNQGDIWISTNKGGIYKYHESRDKFNRYLGYENVYRSFSKNDIWTMMYDPEKAFFWLGTGGSGMIRFNPDNGTIMRFVNDVNNKYSLSSNYVGPVLKSDSNVFWVGTAGGGLNRFEYYSEKYEHFKHNPQNRNTIRSNFILSLYEEEPGVIWIGTNCGLDKYFYYQDRFVHYTEKHGVPEEIIVSMIRDNHNNMWFGTSNGLLKFDYQEQTFKQYLTTDGLISSNFNSGAVYKATDGELFFGTQRGILAFYPEELFENKTTSPLLLTGLKIFNKDVDIGKNTVLQKSISETEHLILDYHMDVITFEFALLNYINPGKNEYAYRLEGFDKPDGTWNYIGKKRSVTFTNLNPGEYILRLKAANNDGYWNEQETSLKLTIKPPWWKTWWFKVSLLLLILGALYTVYKLRLMSIKKHNIKLESQVKERTFEISRQKEDIEKKNILLNRQKDEIYSQSLELKKTNELLKDQQEQIIAQAESIRESEKSKTRFFMNISHEFKTPLTLILGPIKKLLESVNNNHKNYPQFILIYRNAMRLLRLINQLLELNKLQAGYRNLEVHEINISEFISNIFSSFQYRAGKQQIEYKMITHHQPVCGYTDTDKLEKILYNLLSNAFKFTPAGGKITLKTEMLNMTNREFHNSTKTELKKIVKNNNGTNNKRYLKISVNDSGKGIPKNRMEDIFRIFNHYGKDQVSGEKGTGIGLPLAKQLTQALHGDISVTSSPEKGSTFFVILPVDKDCFDPENITKAPEQKEMPYTSELQTTETDESGQDNTDQNEIDASKKSIVVIEDNKDLRIYLRQYLSDYYNITEASDGIKGLEQVKEMMPDLVITDILMPGIDGHELTDKIKTDITTSHIPVIMLTALIDREAQLKGLKTGADDYVTKPFDINLLRARIENLIESRKKLTEQIRKNILLQPKEVPVNSPEESFIRNATAVIEKYIDDPDFSVDIFSTEIGMSRTQLYRKMRAVADQSVNDFIRNYRLQKAAKLLKDNNLSVSEIAFQTGFLNHSYFSKCFEKRFGTLPSKYAGEKEES